MFKILKFRFALSSYGVHLVSGLSPDSYKTQELIIFAKLPGSIDKHSQLKNPSSVLW